MRAVIQRVDYASCECDGIITGKIENGFMVLLGVREDDEKAQAELIAKKIANMRIFRDENDKMNLSLADTNGKILCISQFTLFADCKKGNRPYFVAAARPEKAEPLYEYTVSLLREKYGLDVETGVFGGDMKINLCNSGPVTIILDTDEL